MSWLLGSFRFTYLWTRPTTPSDLGVKKASNTVINIRLVTLSLDSGPKLLWDSEQPGDKVCLRELAVGGNLVCFLIIVVIFMGPGRAFRLGSDFKVIIRGASHKGMEPISCGSWSLKTPCKGIDLAIGEGLGWLKWLKKGAGKGFIFRAITPVPYSFW